MRDEIADKMVEAALRHLFRYSGGGLKCGMCGNKLKAGFYGNATLGLYVCKKCYDIAGKAYLTKEARHES